MIAATKAGARLFRQNVGRAWVGAVVSQSPGRLVLTNYRPLHAGLCAGSSDLIGWTPDGRFLAVEVKSERGRLTGQQERFIEAVRLAGGHAGDARSVEDAMRIIRGDT